MITSNRRIVRNKLANGDIEIVTYELDVSGMFWRCISIDVELSPNTRWYEKSDT